MIEPIMFVAIGFLLAGLLVIGVIPLVHARAVRLTTRRLEALNPLSIAEIQADKDLLRAEFAMSTYRVEKRVEEIKAKATDHLTELGKKSEAIGRLKLELSEKTAALLLTLAEDLKHSADFINPASTEAELAEVRAKLPRSFVTADNKRSALPRPKNSMRALLSVLEEQRDPSKDTQLEQISDDRAGRASCFRQVSMTRGH